jgi:hypothetical protein
MNRNADVILDLEEQDIGSIQLHLIAFLDFLESATAPDSIVELSAINDRRLAFLASIEQCIKARVAQTGGSIQ